MTFAYGVDILGKYTNAASVASVQSLGPTWVRVQIHNASVEYQPPQQTAGGFQYFYNWTNADAAILPWINAGFNISLTLEGFAPWNLDPTCQLPTSQAMVSWGTAMINRYGAGIQSVEMCNEEPAGNPPLPSPSCRNASVYIGIISGAYQTLKNLMPRLQIGMFGYTNYNGRTDSSNGNPAYWFQQFCNGGGDPFVDFYNCHIYKNLYPPTQNTPKGAPAVATIINAIINAQNSISSTKPIRVTEFGYQGLPGNNKVTCPNYIGAALQTVYEVQFFNILSSFPQVSHGFLYTNGAGLAGFYDCHDVQSLSTFGAMQTLFSGSQPPLPPIPGLAQQGDSMSFLAQTEPNNQATLTGGLTITKDVLTGDAAAITCAGVISGTNLVGAAAVLGAIASSSTITTAGVDKVSVAPAAAITGIILQKGTLDGQRFSIVNLGTSTSTVTFAAAATSNVNGGTGTSIAITSVASFVWDAGSALWYLA